MTARPPEDLAGGIPALFSELADLPSGPRRIRLDEIAWTDPAVAEELRSLLDWDASGTGPLDRDLAGDLRWAVVDCGDDPAPDHPPTHVGPYEVLSTLGSGGMGVVYLARRRTPVDRTVALKVIRHAADSDEVRRRFALEQQALAIMCHPGIATVFDSGITDDGCPYFAMEYVPGQSLTAYCDHHRLTVAQRVEIIVKVCGAVNHAHQKGIIHRDLKPSNVLVTTTDEGPVPKVIDFGVALASDPMLLPGGRALTRGAGPIGTLGSMSPEQLELGQRQIDTRADIYAVGALLFELVTGRPPHVFNGDEGLAAIRETLHESPPPRPSPAFAELDPAGLAAIAATRRTTPRRLRAMCRPGLDAILATALAPDRELRYGSVTKMADDLGRWLRAEPVVAHSSRWTYRLGTAIRRHRALAAAALVAIAGLAVGLTVAARSYLEAESARRHAAARLADYRSLADSSHLIELRTEIDRLWPAWPEQLPEMRRLLARARTLQSRRELHLTRLESLGGQSSAANPRGARLSDRHRLTELEQVLESFDGFATGLATEFQPPRTDTAAFLELKRRQVEAEYRRTRDRLGEDNADSLTDAGDPWLSRQLVAVIHDLDSFANSYLVPGTPDSLVDRIDVARTTGEATATGLASGWRAALDQINDPTRCPRYRSLDLAPQHGLLPLGPDPVSRLWEFAVKGTGSPPVRTAAGDLAITGETAVVLILLPGGESQMGAQPHDPAGPNYDPRAWQHEGPVHTVRIAPFFISKYEMTRGQWIRLTGREPGLVTPAASQSPAERRRRARLPVDQVYWFESRDALRRVGLLLPTEAQWEYAARAGTDRPWPGGPGISELGGHANLRDRSKLVKDREINDRQINSRYETGVTDGFPELAPVGSFAPNPFGLHDVFGNAAEWCADWFQVYYCPVEAGTGRRVPADAGPKLRVLRGGHFDSLPAAARASGRVHVNPRTAGLGIGLRPVRPIIRSADDLDAYRW